jgi:hypothetical protein
LYEAVPSIKSEFSVLREYTGENCTGVPTVIRYFRLKTCVPMGNHYIKTHCHENSKVKLTTHNDSSCENDAINTITFKENNCTVMEKTTLGITSGGSTNILATCPLEAPEIQPKRTNRTSDATIAVAVVASLIVVALIVAAIYFQRK